jgi:hypothetical protein
MTERSFFLRRVNDHLQYLNNINKTLANDHCFDEHENVECFKGTQDTDCNLGRWLYGEGAIEISALENYEIEVIFRSLFEPHTRFHAISQEAIKRREAGDKAGAKALITEMKEISTLLTSKMLELEEILQKSGLV